MNPALAAALDALGAFLDPARAFSPAADLPAMRAALKAARAAARKAPPRWYVARYGDSSFGLEVAFFDSALAYGNASRAAAREHETGHCDSYTMGRAESESAWAAAIEEARAKAARKAAKAAKGGR